MRSEDTAALALRGSVATAPVPLTEDESTRLVELEAVVERNYSAVMETRSALVEIKERRLYRATHATFKDYLSDRWNMTPSYASRLLRAGAVVEEARRLSPDVAHGQPPAERAIREVNDLPVEEAAKVLVVATEAARAEGREVADRGDVRKARAGTLAENGGFRRIPRRPLADRAESTISSIENDVEYLLSEIGLDRLSKEQAGRLRAALDSLGETSVPSSAQSNVVEPEPEDEVEAFAAGLAWPRIAKAINPMLDEVPESQRVDVLNGLSTLAWDLSRDWQIKDGPLDQAIRTLEHVASRPDEEFLQHRDERKAKVAKLECLLSDYRARARRLDEKGRQVAALVPGSLWQVRGRHGDRFLHVDRVDEKGLVSFRRDDDPTVVVRQKRETFLEKATIADFSYSAGRRRLGEKVRATFAKAIAETGAK